MITVKVFHIGSDRIFAEFDDDKDRGFHILDNFNGRGKLITKKIYDQIKNKTGEIIYHNLKYSKYFESTIPHQIIDM